jgi:hypothetical protein
MYQTVFTFNHEKDENNFQTSIISDIEINEKLKKLFHSHTEKFEILSRSKFQKKVPKSWLFLDNNSITNNNTKT